MIFNGILIRLWKATLDGLKGPRKWIFFYKKIVIFIQPLCHMLDAAQAKFLNRVQLVVQSAGAVEYTDCASVEG